MTLEDYVRKHVWVRHWESFERRDEWTGEVVGYTIIVRIKQNLKSLIEVQALTLAQHLSRLEIDSHVCGGFTPIHAVIEYMERRLDRTLDAYLASL